MSNQIVLRQDSALAMENAIERYNMLVEFTRHIMQKDIDFGVIPGAGTKPTLYKPGAEKLNNLFSHYPTFTLLDKVLDFDNGRFYFQYQCDLYRIEDGKKVGSGNGSCNSLEVKYRYRQSDRVCPHCGKAAIARSKKEYGGGWYCNAKKGGCGTKFAKGDATIESQEAGRIENTEPFDLVNTLDKMAQKRSFVAATLIACNASAFYTQDVEDMSFMEGEYRVVPEPPEPEDPQDEPGAQPTPQQPAGNTKHKAQEVPETLKALIDAGIARDVPDAAGVMNLSPFTKGKVDISALVAWGKAYRGYRDEGLDSKAAAEKATAPTTAS